MARIDSQEKNRANDTTLLSAMLYERNKKGANHCDSHRMGRAGFEPAKAPANGFTVRPL